MITKDMFEFENKYKNLGFVAGMDEAGRGPLAGPVICACVIMPLDPESIIDGINDSKKLSAKKREMLYDKIISKALYYSIQQVDKDVIDDINILNATKLGMKNAVKNLNIVPYVLLIDAVKLDIDQRQESIIKGDEKSYNIAAASILAKVYRDRLMLEYAKQYPEYCFEKHKGYGTSLHIQKLKEYGPCDIHRRSFIKNFVG